MSLNDRTLQIISGQVAPRCGPPSSAGERVIPARQERVGEATVPIGPAAPMSVARRAVRPRRVLLTHVFTDIVASTETLERLGDEAWCSLLYHHQALVRQHLRAHRGREVDSAGDGFFLVFDRPSQALRFAVDIRSGLKGIGIELRIGIHSGECEVAGGRVNGVAVHTAARIARAAAPGEILVSSTVREILAGSEHRFGGRSPRCLKGLSGPRRLFALQSFEGAALAVIP